MKNHKSIPPLSYDICLSLSNNFYFLRNENYDLICRGIWVSKKEYFDIKDFISQGYEFNSEKYVSHPTNEQVVKLKNMYIDEWKLIYISCKSYTYSVKFKDNFECKVTVGRQNSVQNIWALALCEYVKYKFKKN